MSVGFADLRRFGSAEALSASDDANAARRWRPWPESPRAGVSAAPWVQRDLAAGIASWCRSWSGEVIHARSMGKRQEYPAGATHACHAAWL